MLTDSRTDAAITYAQGKKLAERIFLETLSAIDVHKAMLAQVRREGSILHARDVAVEIRCPARVVAFGKAAHRMAQACAEILEVETGVVVAPAEPLHKLPQYRYIVGGHPYPNAGSLEGAAVALDLISSLKARDLVVFLVSGGGSAILEKALDPATSLADLVEFNRALVTCGLPIEEINVLRKHLSAVKGGRLAIAAHPARQLTIFISDVPEHLPSMIASGPTMPDESTTSECYEIAARDGLAVRFPASIRRHFEARSLQETPKPGDERFAGCQYACLLSNRDAVQAAKAAAATAGFICEVDGHNWDADYRQVARANLESLQALAARHPGRAVAVVAGGEVISPVTGPGVGGRNQAFALYAAQLIAGCRRVVLSAGTDGRDGNSLASGAVADGETVPRAGALGLDPEHFLSSSDSYHFFRPLGDGLVTGFTDNNVRDVRVWLDFGV